ncbi:YTH domain-containing family protein 3-like [Cynara cardunculus var. scolymus]|uniref:YTH domain-containing family protein n=1 Tax=Cynara cardunculus var. scolymus TaxID=59895 RepID=A0A118JUB2_CYNCS|nr:YTH domain-containing family protein 3-like [Cynara cardunculus var. scolymus]KVH90942.1 YTH domain-containing protein [Cynara cardunculus var. scolymus]
MAAVAPPADQAADLLKNLSLDSQTKTLEIPEPTKKPSVDNGNVQVQPTNRSVTPLIPDYMDPAVAYFPNGYPSTAYYYGGYDGTTTDWDEYSRYVNSDGVDMTQGVYGDNGSVMYGYGYAPYGPYSPAGSPMPTVGQDGQFYGAQHSYQYPSPYFQPIAPTGSPFTAPAAPPKGEITAPASADQPPITVETAKGNSNGVVNGVGAKGNTGSAPVRPTPYQHSVFNANGSYGRGAQTAYQDPRFGFDGVHSPIPWLDGSIYSDPQPRNNGNNAPYGNGVASKNQNVRPHSHLMSPRPISGMNTASGYMNRMYPSKLYGQYGNTYRSGYGFGSNAYDMQNGGRGWLAVDNKYKPRGRGNGFFGYNNENSDGLNELNRGPRARSTKNQKVFTPITIAVKGQDITLAAAEGIEKETKEVSVTPQREQYNQQDFPETYTDAKFFIIKSYSEDDVHKSIKYNVWASTQNGNKKLDAAYQEAQQKAEKCPVFLFFSVNTSGQFVGVAEMVGPVDFDKSLEYWQQDKWIGCFPVKWHIVKDLPNSLLKHIILENNENKPVTNSRDTQEVKLDQGLQMIKIFKEHSSKQCILDDFEFYEDRQKRIQEKKAKQQQFQKQVWEGKPTIEEKSKEGVKVEVLGPKPLVNEANPTEAKPLDNVQENVGDGAEKEVVVNGVANGC